MGVLYMAGGNAAAAATNNTTLVFWLNILELAVSAFVLPGVCASVALSLSDCLRNSEVGSLSGISSVIKRSVGYVLGMCCTLLTAALSAQSILSAAADSAKARVMRYVAGNVIPVVGSTVGEALRTVATSVKILRSTVGVSGIIVILLILLPTLVELLLCRLSLSTAAAVGEMVGVRDSVRFFREVASIYGYLIAAVALAAIMCCFALTVFALTSSQSGGL
jgi:stage III sporulation protein AE